MPTSTWIALATTTLSSNSSSITFSSIPSSYKDLALVIRGNVAGGEAMNYSLNGDTTDTNYSRVRMLSDGTSFSTNVAANRQIVNMYPTQGVQTIHFLDYSATDKYKTVLSRSDSPGDVVMAFVSRWSNTDPVTSIQFGLGTMLTGTVLSLYGIEG